VGSEDIAESGETTQGLAPPIFVNFTGGEAA
jgi:hypothetical protein